MYTMVLHIDAGIGTNNSTTAVQVYYGQEQKLTILSLLMNLSSHKLPYTFDLIKFYRSCMKHNILQHFDGFQLLPHAVERAHAGD